MNERQWLECTDAYAMIAFLRRSSNGWFGNLLVQVGWQQDAVDRRRFGLLEDEFARICARYPPEIARLMPPLIRLVLERHRLDNEGWLFFYQGLVETEETLAAIATWNRSASKLCCYLIRDIFGNPFRPPHFDPAWLMWNNGTVVELVRGIYDDRRFTDMPILGDALEEAGCTDPIVLTHCRKPAEHVRGCWLLDRLLEHEIAEHVTR